MPSGAPRLLAATRSVPPLALVKRGPQTWNVRRLAVDVAASIPRESPRDAWFVEGWPVVLVVAPPGAAARQRLTPRRGSDGPGDASPGFLFSLSSAERKGTWRAC